MSQKDAPSGTSPRAKAIANETHFKGHKDRTKNRDKAKTQGGHPKGLWEQDVSLDPCAAAIDKGDPNYDPEEQGDYVLASDTGPGSPRRHGYTDDLPRRQFAKTKLALAEFKKEIIIIIEEFFSSEEFGEVGRSLSELDSGSFHFEFVKRAITMSMDRNDKERELVSKLFSALFEYDRGILSTNQIGKGFERLFEVVDDLENDVPKARTILSQFLARAVVDELLPPSFLSDPLVEGMGGEIVENAIRMLSTYHGTARVEKIWGPGDGRSVPDLKKAVDLLLQEYLTSGDVDEAIRCVKELNTPHFHYEVVKRSIVNAIDKDGIKRKAMADLLKALHTAEVLTDMQMQKGFDRLQEILPDLSLDTPNARTIVEEFTIQAVSDGILHNKNIGGTPRPAATPRGEDTEDTKAAAAPPAAPQ